MNQIENTEAEKALVLWNISDCPIPDGVDPLRVVQTIQAAVEKSGYVRRNGEMAITAVGRKLIENPGEDVMRKLSSFGVSLKNSDEYQMDLFRWAKENPPPSTMMVIDTHTGVKCLQSTLCDLEDKGFRILVAYPRRDLSTPFPFTFSFKDWELDAILLAYDPERKQITRTSCFSKQWDWDALISDDELEATTTSLVHLSKDKRQSSPWLCGVCCCNAFFSLEGLTTHLKAAEHAFGEWDLYAGRNNVDRTDPANMPFGQSKELDLLLDQELRRIKMMESWDGPYVSQLHLAALGP